MRDAMMHIWHATIDDPPAAITRHCHAIMASLLVDLGANQWRVREAAAGAMGDLLQGRHWEEVAPHFASLWEMTFRCGQ